MPTTTISQKSPHYSALHEHMQRLGGATTDQNGLGTHVLGEFLECSSLPTTAAELQEQMEEAARRIGATIVQSVFHEFNPHGLSGAVVIEESHIAIHTWPEYRCASLDIFTCGGDCVLQKGVDYLRDVFGAGSVESLELPRGLNVATEK